MVGNIQILVPQQKKTITTSKFHKTGVYSLYIFAMTAKAGFYIYSKTNRFFSVSSRICLSVFIWGINTFHAQLPKMDEVVKQTYTDHEIMLLLETRSKKM